MLISGLTVIVAMAGMLISGDKIFMSFTTERSSWCRSRCSPRSLFCPRRSPAWRQGREGSHPVSGTPRFGGGGPLLVRITRRVMRSRRVVAAHCRCLLVALAIPALQMKTVVTASRTCLRTPRDQDLQPDQGGVPDRGRDRHHRRVEADDVRSGASAKASTIWPASSMHPSIPRARDIYS